LIKAHILHLQQTVRESPSDSSGAEAPFLSGEARALSCLTQRVQSARIGRVVLVEHRARLMRKKDAQKRKRSGKQTPTYLLELPLVVHAGQAARIRGHLEAGRQCYKAVLSEGQSRLRRIRADPAWARAAGPVCGVSGLHALSRPSDPVMCPGGQCLGECGGALCAEEARFTLLRVRSPTGVDVGKATSYLAPKGSRGQEHDGTKAGRVKYLNRASQLSRLWSGLHCPNSNRAVLLRSYVSMVLEDIHNGLR
jgi:hypothetical protein